jgi:hypothetical protein
MAKVFTLSVEDELTSLSEFGPCSVGFFGETQNSWHDACDVSVIVHVEEPPAEPDVFHMIPLIVCRRTGRQSPVCRYRRT